MRKNIHTLLAERNAPESRPFVAGHLLTGQKMNIDNDGSREPIIQRRFLLVSRWNELTLTHSHKGGPRRFL
jgi:hypothetical protein